MYEDTFRHIMFFFGWGLASSIMLSLYVLKLDLMLAFNVTIFWTITYVIVGYSYAIDMYERGILVDRVK